jgi:peptidoglycan/xylan/chitin deacetylase (PgdA/CDA1 family)
MPRRLLHVLVAAGAAAAVVGAQAGCSASWDPPANEVAVPLASAPPTSALVGSRPLPGAVAPGVVPPVVTSEAGALSAAGTGAVALTFDADLTPAMRERLRDGEVDSYANMAVIDVLEDTGTPATIFFTGLWMDEYPDETRLIVADSRFELATHSQTHRAFTDGCYGLGVVPRDEMLDEVREPIETLSGFTDRATRWFRFPGLCHDEAALEALAPLGITAVDGESSGDAGGRSVDAIVDQTLRSARPGSILVFHLNGGDAAPLTDEALPRILDGLRSRGLHPTTLSEMLGLSPRG